MSSVGLTIGWGLIAAAAMGGFMLAVPLASPILAAALGAFLALRAKSRHFELETRRTRALFERYLAPNVLQRTLGDERANRLEPETRDVTFIVSDLTNFSGLVARLPPTEFGPLINAYFDNLVAVLWKHEATIDKLVGDGIYAFFGAPESQSDHAARAIACAAELDAAAEKLRETFLAEGRGDIGATRFGVATGPALVGNFGGERRLNYTAYGEGVVVAARLQEANRACATRVLIAESTARAAGDPPLHAVGRLTLKGVPDTVAYTLAPVTDSTAPPD